MKNKINIFGIFALTGILLFAACSDLMTPPELSKGGETGTLLVQVGTGEARTLTPSSADLGDLSYNLVIKSSNAIIYEGEIKSEGYTLQANQTYALTVDAFNADKELVASHTESKVLIEVGKTATRKMVQRPVTNVDIPGKFSYTVDLSDVIEEIPDITATLKLKPLDNGNSGDVEINLIDSPSSVDVNLVDHPLALPPGRYEMVIEVVSPRKIAGQDLNIYRREIVYIYSGLTTRTVAGDYEFKAEDFKADVRFSGTAQVVTSDGWVDENYKPTKVSILLDSGAQYSDDDIKEENGVYTWEMVLPSHDVLPTGDLTSANFKVEIQHKTITSKIKETGWITQNNFTPQGKQGIDLTAVTTKIAIAAAVDSGAAITFSDTDVVINGPLVPVTVSITPPANYGLIANSVTINGSSSYISDIVSEATGIKVNAFIPSDVADPQFYANFFHLGGSAVVVPNSYGYSATRVEAYELAADGSLKRIFVSDDTGSGIVDSLDKWEIRVPQNYVFRGAKDSDIHFKVYLASLTAGNPAHYWSGYKEDVYGLTSSSPEVSITATALQPSNGTAVVQGTNSVKISWDDVSAWAAGGINIYRSDNDGLSFPPTPLNTTALAKTVTTYTDTTAFSNYRHVYKVVGIISLSPALVEGPDSLVNVRPQQPGNLTATAITNSHGLLTSVDLSWSYDGAASQFVIERSINGSNFSYLAPVGGSQTSYSDTTVDMVDSQYRYRIKACNSSYYYDSDPKVSPYVGSSVSATAISWSSQLTDQYIEIGEKVIYRLSNSFNYSYANLYLCDRYNTWTGYETVDAQFTVYNNRTKTRNQYDSAYGSYFSLYSSGYYSDLILVVEPTMWSGNGGTYSLYIAN
jgi:hypothetical protein